MKLTDVVSRERTPALHVLLNEGGPVRWLGLVQSQARAELVAALEAARELGATENQLLRAERDQLRAQLENVLDSHAEGAWMARALDAERTRDELQAARELGATPEPVLSPEQLRQLASLVINGRAERWVSWPTGDEFVELGLAVRGERDGFVEYRPTDAARARVAWACGDTP